MDATIFKDWGFLLIPAAFVVSWIIFFIVDAIVEWRDMRFINYERIFIKSLICAIVTGFVVTVVEFIQAHDKLPEPPPIERIHFDKD